jgi:hypothetical protein
MNRESESQCGGDDFLAAQGFSFSWNRLRSCLHALWRRVLRIGQRSPKSLRLCASLPLGERRFVAVVEFERARFLVGGTSSSLVLLSELRDCGAGAEEEMESGAGGLAEVKPGRNWSKENRGNENGGKAHGGQEKC